MTSKKILQSLIRSGDFTALINRIGFQNLNWVVRALGYVRSQFIAGMKGCQIMPLEIVPFVVWSSFISCRYS